MNYFFGKKSTLLHLARNGCFPQHEKSDKMEGYLTLITKGYTTYKLRKVWVVLDRQQLTWYDSLDLSSQLPKKLKGVLFIRDASIKKVKDPSATHAIQIICNDNKTLFGCENDTICSSWYKALIRALPLHTQQAEKASLPRKYMEVLCLDYDEKLTKGAIARSYKRLCLKEHPDKGGDVEKFNQINTAYNYLIALQAAEEELEKTVPLQYEATIRKKSGKLGLCMSVNEDRINERLLVGRVQEEIDVVEIDPEAGGYVKPGDRIIGIDHDDCSHWPLSRLLPRLGLVRVPVGGTVVFTFERRVAPDELDDDDDFSEMTPLPSPVPPTIIRTNFKNATSQESCGDGAPPVTPKSSDNIDSNLSPINPEITSHTSTASFSEHALRTSKAAPDGNTTVPPVKVNTPLSVPMESSVSTPFPPTGPVAATPESTAPTSASSAPPTPAEARAAALARRKQRLAEESASASAASAAPPLILLMPTTIPEQAAPLRAGALIAPPLVPEEGSVFTGELSSPLRMEGAELSSPQVNNVLNAVAATGEGETEGQHQHQQSFSSAVLPTQKYVALQGSYQFSPPSSPPPPPPPSAEAKEKRHLETSTALRKDTITSGSFQFSPGYSADARLEFVQNPFIIYFHLIITMIVLFSAQRLGATKTAVRGP